jgi:hypothetical protein
MDIDLDDAKVAELALDYTLRVRLEPWGRLMIEVPISLERDGKTRLLPVGDADLTGEFALDDLVGRRLVAGHATDDGVLTLDFEGGVRITATVDADYESWELVTPTNAVYSAGPEARTRYSPRPASSRGNERHANASDE